MCCEFGPRDHQPLTYQRYKALASPRFVCPLLPEGWAQEIIRESDKSHQQGKNKFQEVRTQTDVALASAYREAT